MEKYEIIELVKGRILRTVEETIAEVIREVNAQGHAFRTVKRNDFRNDLIEWAEKENETLSIYWSLNMGFDNFNWDDPIDPVFEEFISIKERKDDAEAKILWEFCHGMGFGGFLTLYEKEGGEFFEKVISILKKIKSKSTLRLVERVFHLLEGNKTSIVKFRAMEEKLIELEKRYFSLKERPPKLFIRYRLADKD
jgi:hypothetical protein